MKVCVAIMAALDAQRRRDLFRLGIETDEPVVPFEGMGAGPDSPPRPGRPRLDLLR